MTAQMLLDVAESPHRLGLVEVPEGVWQEPMAKLLEPFMKCRELIRGLRRNGCIDNGRSVRPRQGARHPS